MKSVCSMLQEKKYTRLYENPFPNAPKSSDGLGFEPDNTLKSYMAVARSLYPDKYKWENEFIPAVANLIDEYGMIDYMSGYVPVKQSNTFPAKSIIPLSFSRLVSPSISCKIANTKESTGSSSLSFIHAS